MKISIPVNDLEPGYVAMRIDKFFSEIGKESETKLQGRAGGSGGEDGGEGEKKHHHHDFGRNKDESKSGLGLGFRDNDMETDEETNMKADGSIGTRGAFNLFKHLFDSIAELWSRNGLPRFLFLKNRNWCPSTCICVSVFRRWWSIPRSRSQRR